MKERIVPLPGRVVIAERRVEHDPCVDQRLVRPFEARGVVLGRAGRVDVVAEHQDEAEVERFPPPRHLIGGVVLRAIAAAGVAHHRKSE